MCKERKSIDKKGLLSGHIGESPRLVVMALGVGRLLWCLGAGSQQCKENKRNILLVGRAGIDRGFEWWCHRWMRLGLRVGVGTVIGSGDDQPIVVVIVTGVVDAGSC